MNATETGNGSLMSNDSQMPMFVRKIGNKTFEVFVHFSKTSNETLTDKLMRLMRNDIQTEDF